MTSPTLSIPVTRVRCNWIIDRKNDLIWYIGSALAGWLYVGVILYAIRATQNPLTDALETLRLGGLEIPLTFSVCTCRSRCS